MNNKAKQDDRVNESSISQASNREKKNGENDGNVAFLLFSCEEGYTCVWQGGAFGVRFLLPLFLSE